MGEGREAESSRSPFLTSPLPQETLRELAQAQHTLLRLP